MAFDPKLVEIAEALVACCREGREAEGLDALYDEAAVSVESADMPDGGPRRMEGLAAIRAKHEWWDANVEVHTFSADGPFLHGDDRFAVLFDVDFTMKEAGTRIAMREVAVYRVAGGRIVSEEFYNRP